jgi:hypothetical protein
MLSSLAAGRIDVSRKQLADQLAHKFSGPQLVNNFTVQLEPAFTVYVVTCDPCHSFAY